MKMTLRQRREVASMRKHYPRSRARILTFGRFKSWVSFVGRLDGCPCRLCGERFLFAPTREAERANDRFNKRNIGTHPKESP